nr:hypothetical protein [Tanacetum cinerariifolium]
MEEIRLRSKMEGRPSDTHVCYLCTCEQCGNILNYGTCLICNSRTGNSFTYDPIPESFDEVQIIPDPPPQCHFNIYLCQICESNSHYGYECSQRVPLVYEPKPCYIQNFSDNDYSHDLPDVNPLIDHHCCYKCGNLLNDFFYECTCKFCGNGAHVGYNCPAQVPSFQTLPSFPQQYPCCEDCGGLPEADHCQPPSKKKSKLKKIKRVMLDIGRFPFAMMMTMNYNFAITPNEPVDSLIMGDEHLNTILTTESDEFIKSSVENLVPNPSESKGENGCDVPACFTTFLNILFDVDYDFYSSDDQSLSNEDFPKEIYSNPLFDEEMISMKIDPHHFNVESDLIESLLNQDSSITSSSKIDSLFDEFTGELTLLKSILPRIDETDCHPEEETHFIKRLLYDNSSPRPPKEFVSENSNAKIESFSPSPIPVEDIDSFMEEIDLSFTLDDPMPPGIEEDNYDSERDILIYEELLDNHSLSLPENESFNFDTPSSSRPPAKPPDCNTGILNIKMIGDISEQKDCPECDDSRAFSFCPSFTRASHPWLHFGNPQEEKRIEEEQVASAQYWKIPSCCDDEDDYNSAITLVLSTEEPVDSLSMGDEHLNTILAMESDKVIKSSVENLVPIPSEFEGIPDTMCDMHLVNNPTPLEAKDHYEIVINSNDDISSSGDDYLYNENIEYVEASPHDSELVSLEAAEIVIPEVEEIEDDHLREKLLNVHLLIANIEALKDNPASSSEFLAKSSSTSPKSFLGEAKTFYNSLPEFENFCFDLEEIGSGSTTTHSDVSLSEYDSFIFDLSNDQFTPTDRSDIANEEFTGELAHIISPPEYDRFYFWNLLDLGELISILNSGIRENLSSTTCVNLPIEDEHSPLLAYVV